MKKNNLLYGLLYAVVLIILSGCENDIEKIKIVTRKEELADLTMENAILTYTDTSKIKAKIYAKKLKRFSLEKNPHTEFPEGAKVEFYNEHESVSSVISADYAIYFEEKELWEGKGNVVAVNDKGEQLNTEHIFWDMKTEKIYSEKYSKITTADGVFTGKKGFDAEQDFSKWRLKGSEGIVNVKDENQ